MDARKRRQLAIYGLSAEDYNRILEWQVGACAICGRKFTPSRPACIDHHHKTGRVRGLLCPACNYDLGALHEDVQWLESAAMYLRTDPADLLYIEAYHKDAPPHM